MPASIEVGDPLPSPTPGAGNIAELVRAMMAMLEAYSRQAERAPNVANPAPPPVPRPRLNVPTPMYLGYSDGKSVHDFLQELDACVAALGISDQAALEQIVPIAQKGDAACWKRLQQPFHSMADFRARLIEDFLPPDYEVRVRDELSRRTQHPKESLVEYVRALQEL